MMLQASSTDPRFDPVRSKARPVPPCRSASRERAASGAAKGCGLALQPGLVRGLLLGLPISIALWGVIIWLLVALL